ncbi:MFS transporter [Streptomyces sp. NEAU-Y11]|uniref:MFS transporter n=1 Tax=Streptomyces cucumeris TaxID=2962890 RepID=UPI0020C89D13|nr:MFS transporter [Streptomyces sp. NEAU-Y11]MCP9211492.1 MFS transporter [Streptomyces sp. NEAU-Y11]
MAEAENSMSDEETAGVGQEEAVRNTSVPHRLRWASMAPFFLTGFVFASYFVRIPWWKSGFGLSEGELGVLLMVPVLTGLLAMQATGGLVGRFGSASVVRVASLALPLSLVAMVPATSADSLVWFGVALALFGAADGLIDVSINAHGIAVEKAIGRRIMNSCHAAWSIGSAVGSMLGGVALKVGLSLIVHYTAVGAAMILLALAAGSQLLPAQADRTRSETKATDTSGNGSPARSGALAGWSARLLLLGLTGTVVLVASGAVGNWSGIYLHDDLDASIAVASLGYIGFSACEAGGRLVGDRLHERYGARTLVCLSGGVAVFGLAVAVLALGPLIAVAGFALLGLGLSVLVPIIFSSVGHGGEELGATSAADALAKVNTMSYTGLLIGPVLVGWSAEGIGLRATLGGMVVLLAATMATGLRKV